MYKLSRAPIKCSTLGHYCIYIIKNTYEIFIVLSSANAVITRLRHILTLFFLLNNKKMWNKQHGVFFFFVRHLNIYFQTTKLMKEMMYRAKNSHVDLEIPDRKTANFMSSELIIF